MDGSAYEELMLSLQYCMEYILGGGGGWIVFFGTVNGTGVLASSATNSNPSCAPRANLPQHLNSHGDDDIAPLTG